MAFEIVDGMTGTKHISSDDLSALNTATIGKADCVLKYGDDFALTMASANSATLGTGVGMVGGRRFWNQVPTSLTIQSGTQSQKRNDLIVARYSRTTAGIESIEPVVIKGTPTTGAPADPEVTANDLKLWRVPLDGINAGTPVALFETMPTMAELGGSHKSVIKSARVGNSGMLTLECAEDGSWISLRGTAFWSKYSDAWASMVQIPGYTNGSDWYIDTGLTVPNAPAKAKRFDGVGWQCTASTVQPMYINNLCIIVAASGKVYLGEWSKNHGSVQFIAVPNGGRMSMSIGY